MPNSQYNAYKNASFDMSLRTKFAAKEFPPAYWQMVLATLIPAIDEYLYNTVLKWRNASEETKEQLLRLTAESLRFIAGMMAEDGFGSYGLLQSARKQEWYLKTFLELLISNANACLNMRDSKNAKYFS